MRSIRFKRLLPCILLSLSLIVTVFALPQKVNIVKADDVTKKVVYVVMDTSGSMYYDIGTKQPQKRWCQAKYALQAFALMMDFDKGDQLRIYPMHEVSIGKSVGAEHVGNDPWRKIRKNKEYLSINSRNDVGKIADIYACSTQNGTPFSTVETANKDLRQADATNADRWLVVLTDGKFTVFNVSTKKTTDDANARVRKFATDGINVEYMLFGDENGEEVNEGPYHQIIRKSNSDDGDVIIGGVVKACNQVFNRDLLTSKQINGNKIKCDLSWSKLIVFAQDKDIEIGTLDNAKTKESAESDDKPKIKYSTLSRNKPGRFAGLPDTNLQGQIATFKKLKSGNEYEINVGNKTLSQLVDEGKCIVCYEPDVQVKVNFKNSKGKSVDLRKELKPDKYTLDIELYDKQTGKKLSKGDIGDIKFKDSKVMIDGKERARITDAHTDDIVIKGDDQGGEIFLSGTYGKNVKYSLPLTNGSYSFGVNQQLLMHIDKLQSNYSIENFENGDGLDIKLAMNNRQLTDEEDAEANPISIESKPKIDYQIEKKGRGYYNVKFKSPSGNKSKLEKGKYNLTITAKIGKSQNVQKETITVFSWVWFGVKLVVLILILVILYLIIRYILKKRRQYMETLIGPENEGEIRVNNKKTVYVYGNKESGHDYNGIDFKTRDDKYEPLIPEEGMHQKFFTYETREYKYKILSAYPIDHHRNEPDYEASLGVTLDLRARTKRGRKRVFKPLPFFKKWEKISHKDRNLDVIGFKYSGPDFEKGKLDIGDVEIEYLTAKRNKFIDKDGWYVNGETEFSEYIKETPIIIHNGSEISVYGKKMRDNRMIQLRYTVEIEYKKNRR